MAMAPPPIQSLSPHNMAMAPPPIRSLPHQLYINKIFPFHAAARRRSRLFASSIRGGSSHFLPITDEKKDPNNLLLVKRRRNNGTHHYYSALLPTTQNCDFSPKYDDIIQFKPPLRMARRYHVVAGSCNGLVCLDDLENNVLLWNPSFDDDFKLLPHSTVQRPSPPPISPPGKAAVITDPFCTGFGFDCRSNDYKVIRFVNNFFEEIEEEGTSSFLDCQVQVDLYSLKSNTWKEISPLPYSDVTAVAECSAYVNGSCYWYAVEKKGIILSFDFAEEKFSCLPFPPNIHTLRDGFELVEVNGSLGMITYPLMGTEKSFHLWVMNGSGTWTREFVFHTCGVESPLGFSGNGEVLFLESLDNELLLFDRATGTLQNSGISSEPGTMKLIPYVESLVPLNGRASGQRFS